MAATTPIVTANTRASKASGIARTIVATRLKPFIGRSAKVAIHVYAGAYHDFDHPSRRLQVRSGSAFSADGSGRVSTGTDPAARADALKRVPEWLKR